MQESWEASEENYGGEKMKLHVEDEMRLGGRREYVLCVARTALSFEIYMPCGWRVSLLSSTTTTMLVVHWAQFISLCFMFFFSLLLLLCFSLSLVFCSLSLSLSSVPAFAFLFDQREREKKTVVVVGKQGGRERLYLAFEYFLRAFRFKSPSLFLYISNCATGYVGGNLERVFVQLWRYTAKARQEKRGCTPVSIKVHRPVNLGND